MVQSALPVTLQCYDAESKACESPTVLFLSRGEETAEQRSGDEIKRTDLKGRVEALLPRARDPAAAERA